MRFHDRIAGRVDRTLTSAHNRSVIRADPEQGAFHRAARTVPRDYRAQIDTLFEVEGAEGPIPLRLVRISDDVVINGFLQFSLFFHGPPARLLPQGIYVLGHPSLGALALFIVPILGSNHERIVYEACFNRRVTPADPQGAGSES
jgi:hypothetical protein